MRVSKAAARATAHNREVRRLRGVGAIGPRETLRYDPEEPPPSPRKRKADAVDDNDLANAKKKQRQESVAQAALASKPNKPVNPKTSKPTEPSQKRKRDAEDAEDKLSKKQKPTSHEERAAKPAASSVRSTGANSSQKPMKNVEMKSVKTAANAPPNITTNAPRSTTTQAQSSTTAQAQPYTIRKAPPGSKVNDDGTITVPAASSFTRRTYTYDPKQASKIRKRTVVVESGPGQQLAPGQKRKSEDEGKDSQKKRKQGVPAKPSGSNGASQPPRTTSKPKAPESPPAEEVKPRGLLNYKRACFANAVLQCLARCDDLVDHCKPMSSGAITAKTLGCPPEFLTAAGRYQKGSDTARDLLRKSLINRKDQISVSSELGQIFRLLQQACQNGKPDEENAVDPILFSQTFRFVANKITRDRRFDGETSEDCSEFLQELLRLLESEERRKDGYSSKSSSVIERLFGGETVETVKCDFCKDTINETTNKFLSSLSLPMREVEQFVDKDRVATNLKACLAKYTTEELDEQDRCVRCKKAGGVRTRTQLGSELPQYLAVSIGRTKSDGSKNTIPIDVPIGIQYLTPYLHNRPAAIGQAAMGQAAIGPRYRLFGFVEHEGDLPTEGHYTAVVNTPGGWYNFNDHRVAKLTTENVEKKHQNGVMFFLKRVA